MNAFDGAVLGWLDDFARRWPAFDRWVAHVAFNDLFKGAFAMALVWWSWARRPDAADVRERRAMLVGAVLATLAALAVNRVLASLLPHRPRPIHLGPDLFTAPFGVRTQVFNDLSAFPSDHAVMFVGLALGLLAASRGLGVLAFLHAAVVVLLPRLYLGLHYPTDELAGAALAALFVLPALRPRVRDRLAAPFLSWSVRHPPSFLAAAFLVGFGFATLFDPLVRLARHAAGA